MSIDKYAVVTAEPDGKAPILSFFPNLESAADHARRICKDLNRDSFVLSVLVRNVADRQEWIKRTRAEEKRVRANHALFPTTFEEVVDWLREHMPPGFSIEVFTQGVKDRAAGRFLFANGVQTISVYYDTKGNFGARDRPYYEIFPNAYGDAERFYPEEIDKMLIALVHSIDNNMNYND